MILWITRDQNVYEWHSYMIVILYILSTFHKGMDEDLAVSMFHTGTVSLYLAMFHTENFNK